MELVIKVPGSCGELVQGTLNGESFLVTCPIDRYTTVRISDSLSGCYGLKSKASQALLYTLARFKCKKMPFGISLESELPIGKGMASSSADIAAVMLGVSAALGKCFTAEEVLAQAAAIDPTDGVFCKDIVSLNYLTGKILTKYNYVPPLKIAIFDSGGEINTEFFHARADLSKLNAANEGYILRAINLLAAGMRSGDEVKIAKAATYSAKVNQNIIYKEHLADLWQINKDCGALGVNVAHSGTVAGVLWSSKTDEKYIKQAVSKVSKALSNWQFAGLAKLISGGFTIRRSDE